jgi:hypothetical protein
MHQEPEQDRTVLRTSTHQSDLQRKPYYLGLALEQSQSRSCGLTNEGERRLHRLIDRSPPCRCMCLVASWRSRHWASCDRISMEFSVLERGAQELRRQAYHFWQMKHLYLFNISSFQEIDLQNITHLSRSRTDFFLQRRVSQSSLSKSEIELTARK